MLMKSSDDGNAKRTSSRSLERTVVIQHNILGREIVPSVMMDRRRRRLSTIVAHHAPKSRPFIVSVHRRGQPLRPTDDVVKMRAEWSKTLVGPLDTVVITQLPLGGKGEALQIGGAIALLAVAVLAPYALGFIAPAVFGVAGALTLAGQAAVAGLVVAGGYFLSKATQPKANATDETRPLYGVSGGGNLPRPGDRIPRGYGLFWTQPDLSQADYSVYDGDDTILYKRMTLGLGKYQVHKIEIGDVTLWDEDTGVQAPFSFPTGGDIGRGVPGQASGSGGGSEVEILDPGDTSALVPSSVYTSPDVAGSPIARTGGSPSTTGPFPVCPVGETTSRIQVDFALPGGAFGTATNGTQIAASWGVKFEYAPCDDDDTPTGAFVGLYDTGVQSQKITSAQVFSRVIDVADGRYVVRAQNLVALSSTVTNEVRWDGLRAHFADSIVRPHVTEIAIKVRSGSRLTVTQFNEIWVQATAILPVWNGTTWVDTPTRKCVHAFADILRASYGGNLADEEIDLATILFYADELSEFDTFDGVIRGPVSVFEAAGSVLGPMRGEPIRLGNTWSLMRDEERSIKKHVFTRRQIVRGSTGSTFTIARDDGAADVIAEYSPDADPRRRRDLRVTFGEETITPTRVSLLGVSAWDHAHHLATFKAAVAYFRRETRKFTVDRRGRIVRRGQPAIVDSWFMSTARAAGITSRSGLTVKLDTDVVFDGPTYALIRDRANREWGPVLVTAGADAHTIVLDTADVAAAEVASDLTLAQALAGDGQELTSVLVGPIAEFQDSYLIESVEPQSRDRVSISAKFDHPDVWAALGETPPDEPPIPSLSDSPIPSKPVIPWVHAECVQEGTSIFMKWAVGRARGAASNVVILSYDDGETWETVNSDLSTSGSYALRHEEGATVKVRAYAVGVDGVPGPAVNATFTTTKPAINEDTSDISLSLEALSEEIQAALAQVAPTFELAQKLLDTQNLLITALQPDDIIRKASDLGLEAAKLIPPAIFERINVVSNAALGAVARLSRLEHRLVEAGFGTHTEDGRYTIEGLQVVRQGLGDFQSSVSVVLDVLHANISLKASTSYVNDLAQSIIQGFVPAYRYEFNGTSEGWTASGVTITNNIGSITTVATTTSPLIASPTIALNADANRIINVQIRRRAGTNWNVNLLWGGGFGVSKSFPVPTSPDSWNVISLDMTDDPTWTGTLTGLELTLGAAASDSFEVDYIELGNSRLQDLLLQDVEARLASAEISIDGLTGTIDEKASVIEVANLRARITDAEVTISAQEAEITLKVDTTELDAATTRISSAEINIGTLQNLISLQVQTSGVLSAQAAAKAALAGLLQNKQDRDNKVEYLAKARQELQANIDETGNLFALSRTSLQAQISDAVASVTSEQSARITADSAEATARLVLNAQVNDPVTGLPATFSGLATEASVRATADSAEATLRTVLASTVNDPTTGLAITRATVLQEISDRVTAVSAEATSRLALAATVTAGDATNAAAILTEQSARATADTAEATARTSLAAVVSIGDATNAAAVVTEASARATADSAEAALRVALASTVSGVSAAVTSEASTRASADSALSSSISSVSTTVGGHTAALGTLMTSTDGTHVFGGMIGVIDGVTGGFILQGMLNPDHSVSYTMMIQGNLIVDGTLTGNKIQANTIQTTNLIADAATRLDTFSEDHTIPANGSVSTICTVPFTGGGYLTSIKGHVYCSGGPFGDLRRSSSSMFFVLRYDGVEVSRFYIPAVIQNGVLESGNTGVLDFIFYFQGSGLGWWVAATGAGSHTVTLDAQGIGPGRAPSDVVSTRSLIEVLQAKR